MAKRSLASSVESSSSARQYDYDPCTDKSLYPLDVGLGLENGYTPWVVR